MSAIIGQTRGNLRSVEALMSSAEEHAAKTMPAGSTLRAVLPQRGGWIAIFDPAVTTASSSTSADAATEAGSARIPRSAMAAIVMRPAESGYRTETVRVEDDSELPAARQLLAGRASGQWMDRSPLRAASLCAYRPRRRAQIRLLLDQGPVFAKVMRRTAWKRAVSHHRWLEAAARARGTFNAPRLLHADRAERLMICRGVDAPSLLDLLGDRRGVDQVRRTGIAMRALHTANLDVGGSAAWSLAAWRPNVDWLADLRDQLRLLGEDVPVAALELAIDIVAHLPPSGRRAVVHGDLYDKQVLCGERITFLDPDTMSIGDPAIDVGNVLAHLRLRGLQGRTWGGSEVLGRALLAGYGAVATEFSHTVRLAEAASLARLSAVYALRPRWRHVSGELARLATEAVRATGRRCDAPY